MRPATASSRTAHLIGLRCAGPLAVAAFALCLLFGRPEIGFTGPGSLQMRLLVISLTAVPLAYVYGFLRMGRYRSATGGVWRVRLATQATTVAVGVSMLVLFLVPVLSRAFVGYTFPWFWGAVTASAYALVVSYTAAVLGARAWVGDLVLLAVAVALVGVLAAATLSGADEWWKTAISALGTEWSMSWRIFDVACASAGAMLLLASLSARPALEAAARCGIARDATVRWFPRVMAVVAVLLCFVGLFPMDGNRIEFVLHNIGGIGFGVTLFVAMLLTGRAFPGVPGELVWYSWAFAALTALATLAFRPFGAFSLAELEVVAFGFEGLWAILLFATVRDRIQHHGRESIL